MIGELHKAAVVVESVAEAERFYTGVLGLTVSERIPSGTAADDEDYVMLAAGSTTLELMPRKAMGVAPGFHHLSFRVDDVDAAAAALRGEGVTLEKAPFDAAGNLRLAFFRGPDGVLLQLFQRR
jgi:methylmalonyl-CoA/ethylmalonyl-CoA epimerase